MLLELKDVHIHYQSAEAVKGVSMSVGPNEFVSLIGANGAGKSTILRAVSGLKAITSGEIWFQGQRIDKLSSVEIVKLNLIHVPQGGHIFQYMSVIDNIIMGAYLEPRRAEIKSRLEQVFSHFPVLKERQRQRAGSLSGGERQMLVIGRSLMSKPALLMIDEPSLGLSPLLVKALFSIIENIYKSGVPILLVEQNVRLALQVSQRGYCLETGNVAFKGDCKVLETSERVKEAYLGG